MATTFPYGYKPDASGVLGMGTRLTRAQLESMTTIARLDPEFWRRQIAMYEEAARQGVPLGPGTGWRIQPNPPPPGFAKPGNSNHEGFMDDEAVAVDNVPDRSWTWMQNNCARFHLRTFRDVNSEPWHTQPSEIPAGRDWRTQPWNLKRVDLPGPPTLPRVPRPVLRKGNKGLAVRRLINLTKFFKWYPARFMGDKNDGIYGDRLVRGVKNMQRALKVPIHGTYDRRTARALSNFLKAVSQL